jgi:hypothetical protein
MTRKWYLAVLQDEKNYVYQVEESLELTGAVLFCLFEPEVDSTQGMQVSHYSHFPCKHSQSGKPPENAHQTIDIPIDIPIRFKS